LEKLPKQIVKDGKIIAIRDAIEKKLDGIKKQQPNEHYTEDEQGTATMLTPVQSEFEAGNIK
jgi:ribosome recycling factor